MQIAAIWQGLGAFYEVRWRCVSDFTLILPYLSLLDPLVATTKLFQDYIDFLVGPGRSRCCTWLTYYLSPSHVLSRGFHSSNVLAIIFLDYDATGLDVGLRVSVVMSERLEGTGRGEESGESVLLPEFRPWSGYHFWSLIECI